MRSWKASCILAANASLAATAAAQQHAQQDHSSAATHSAQHDSIGAHNVPQYRASKLVGAPVLDASGEKLGEIADLVISAEGSVDAVVLSVGGFLDVGDRLVAAAYDELRVTAEGELYLPVSEQDIAARPDYRLNTAAVAPSPQPAAPEAAPLPQPPAPEVDAATHAEAEDKADESFAGNDPRVAEGIAENIEAYEDDDEDVAATTAN